MSSWSREQLDYVCTCHLLWLQVTGGYLVVNVTVTSMEEQTPKSSWFVYFITGYFPLARQQSADIRLRFCQETRNSWSKYSGVQTFFALLPRKLIIKLDFLALLSWSIWYWQPIALWDNLYNNDRLVGGARFLFLFFYPYWTVLHLKSKKWCFDHVLVLLAFICNIVSDLV